MTIADCYIDGLTVNGVDIAALLDCQGTSSIPLAYVLLGGNVPSGDFDESIKCPCRRSNLKLSK